jgi:hypothetical protein
MVLCNFEIGIKVTTSNYLDCHFRHRIVHLYYLRLAAICADHSHTFGFTSCYHFIKPQASNGKVNYVTILEGRSIPRLFTLLVTVASH